MNDDFAETKLSELISHLEMLKQKNGDLYVICEGLGGYWCPVVLSCCVISDDYHILNNKVVLITGGFKGDHNI